MMHTRWLRIIVSALGFASLGGAMDPEHSLSQYAHRHWNSEQGLPDGAVLCLAETSDGYLWIGTERGLARFDGSHFQVYTHLTTPVLPPGPVLELTATPGGELWIRTQGSALTRYRQGQFDQVTTAQTRQYSAVTALGLQNDGKVMAATLSNQLFQTRSGRLVERRYDPRIPNFLVVSIAQTADETVWMGTRDQGLFSLGKGLVQAEFRGLRDRKINCLLTDGKRRLWIGTESGLLHWNGSAMTADDVPEPLRNVPILSIQKDRESNPWVGTPTRLARINASGVSFLEDPRVAPATAILEDRDGDLWTGGPQGLDRFQDSLFLSYSGLNKSYENNGAIYADDHGRIWFAPSSGGLFFLKNDQVERVELAGLERDVVYSISGGGGELWVGRQQGLTRLVDAGGRLSATNYTHAEGLPVGPVFTLWRCRDGSVWAGMLNGGVSHLQNGRFTNYTTANGLASSSISAILEALDGTMWFATSNGLNSYSGGRWKLYNGQEGLPPGHINCLMQDSEGIIWIGTSAGLVWLRAAQIKSPGQIPDMLRAEVLAMVQEKEWLWVVTSSQVLRVKRTDMLSGSFGLDGIREFGIHDGLPATEGIQRDRSALRDAQGRVWLSLSRSLSMVNPTRLVQPAASPLVHMQAVSTDGNLIGLTDSIHIPSLSRRVVFSFAGLSLSHPERIQYRYMLDGFDRGWSLPTANTEAGYSNLRAGNYRFRVLAGNANGPWSSSEASVGLAIDPMFWQTWWFDLAALLSFCGAAAALYRYRMRLLTSHLNLRFAERLAERNRIAQELHDTLLQGVVSASMQLHITLDSLEADAPARSALANILRTLKQVMDEGRNTVQALRSSYSGPPDLEQALRAAAADVDITGGALVEVSVTGSKRALHPMLRDEAYGIARQALVSAFRSSSDTDLKIELEYSKRRFRMRLRSSAEGADPVTPASVAQREQGLQIMRERAAKAGGQLYVWTNAQMGTDIELSVPGMVAYPSQASARIVQWLQAMHRMKMRDSISESAHSESESERSR